jgi:hypothetical protein
MARISPVDEVIPCSSAAPVPLVNDDLKEGFERTLGAVEKPSRGLKVVLAFAVLAVAIVIAAIYSRSPS